MRWTEIEGQWIRTLGIHIYQSEMDTQGPVCRP